MIVLVVVVFLTLSVSASCSLFEAVLYSTRMGTLESAKKKDRLGHLADQFIAMKKNISVPIAAILILNTIANTAGATIAGMYATKVLGVSHVPLFSIFFTMAILFFSEIMPKNIGAVHWRRIWPLIVWPLNLIRQVLYPAIYVTDKFSQLINRGNQSATITEDEILALVHLGAHEGEISQEESRLVKNIIDLENKSARDIMTPRTMIYSLDVGTTAKEACELTEGKAFTRIPVYEGDKEDIVGYVMRPELSSPKYLEEPETPVGALVRPITFLPETINCLVLLITLLKQQKHIAILADEYGGVAGLVTLEDVIETLLGTEIVDETDKIVDLQKVARKRAPVP